MSLEEHETFLMCGTRNVSRFGIISNHHNLVKIIVKIISPLALSLVLS